MSTRSLLSRALKSRFIWNHTRISKLKGEVYSTAMKAKALLRSMIAGLHVMKFTQLLCIIGEKISKAFTVVMKECELVVVLNVDRASGWKEQHKYLNQYDVAVFISLLSFPDVLRMTNHHCRLPMR